MGTFDRILTTHVGSLQAPISTKSANSCQWPLPVAELTDEFHQIFRTIGRQSS
jgi:hypothetical protein